MLFTEEELTVSWSGFRNFKDPAEMNWMSFLSKWMLFKFGKALLVIKVGILVMWWNWLWNVTLLRVLVDCCLTQFKIVETPWSFNSWLPSKVKVVNPRLKMGKFNQELRSWLWLKCNSTRFGNAGNLEIPLVWKLELPMFLEVLETDQKIEVDVG